MAGTEQQRESPETGMWTVSRVLVHGVEEAPEGEGRLVLTGVYEASDEAALAGAVADVIGQQILHYLRQRPSHSRSSAAQPGRARVRLRVTLEHLPDGAERGVPETPAAHRTREHAA